VVTGRVSNHFPSREDFARSAGAIGRGTLIGSLLGVLPGGGAVISSFAAYTLEKRVSREPDRFGKGAIEGVAAPESANNAAAQTAFIPLLTLGIPGNAVTALILGAMTMQGIVPGPQIMITQPTLVWAVIVSMWIGNFLLLIINLPLIGLWVSMLRVPYRLLFPAVLIFCCIGAYSVNNSSLDVVLTALFGLVGYWMIRHEFEPAPMILGLVLGPILEENLRRAVIISNGDPTIFLTRPVSAVLLVLAAVLLVLAVLPAIRGRRDEVFVENE
jgi:putative tricarboxylic transport membrane protein